MLLIVGCASDAGNDSKHGAKSVVHAINRVGYPTAPASVPPFTFQDRVERGARTGRRRHCAQRSRVRFFLKRAFSQELLNILLPSQGTLGLIVKFRFVPLFRGFHPANSDLRAGNFVPPTV